MPGKIGQVFDFRIHRGQNSIGIANRTGFFQGNEFRFDHLLANHLVNGQKDQKDTCQGEHELTSQRSLMGSRIFVALDAYVLYVL
jgi:hypothetical protein